MSIYFNTKKRRKLFKRVLYNLGILLCSDVKDYLSPTVYRIRNVLYVKSVHKK